MPYYIYVIKLDPRVLDIQRFREANPDYVHGQPCVYVGSSAEKPEDRFAKHMAGGKTASSWVKNFGMHLKPRFYESHNPMDTREEAVAMEVEKARRLRKRGWGVWQK